MKYEKKKKKKKKFKIIQKLKIHNSKINFENTI
jgi:hypothetical protein